MDIGRSFGEMNTPLARQDYRECEAAYRNKSFLTPGVCPVNGEDLFPPLFAGCQGYINIRAIRSSENPKSEFYPIDNLQWLPGVIKKYCGSLLSKINSFNDLGRDKSMS